jgi:hypothetical protein
MTPGRRRILNESDHGEDHEEEEGDQHMEEEIEAQVDSVEEYPTGSSSERRPFLPNTTMPLTPRPSSTSSTTVTTVMGLNQEEVDAEAATESRAMLTPVSTSRSTASPEAWDQIGSSL